MQSNHIMIEISEHSNVQGAQINSKIKKYLQFTARLNTSLLHIMWATIWDKINIEKVILWMTSEPSLHEDS